MWKVFVGWTGWQMVVFSCPVYKKVSPPNQRLIVRQWTRRSKIDQNGWTQDWEAACLLKLLTPWHQASWFVYSPPLEDQRQSIRINTCQSEAKHFGCQLIPNGFSLQGKLRLKLTAGKRGGQSKKGMGKGRSGCRGKEGYGLFCLKIKAKKNLP